MTRKELPTEAANINRSLVSTATCTQATVDSLRSILLPEKMFLGQQKKPPTTGRGTKGTRNTKAPYDRSKKVVEVAILEVPETTTIFSPQERLKLATGVINTTLKALTDAIKRPSSPLAPSTKPCMKRSSSSSSLLTNHEAGSHIPLQPLCPNRLSSTPEKPRPSRRSASDKISRDRAGLIAQAECARIAFTTLRTTHVPKALGLETPYLQLETGMSALIGKLIALGLDDLAVKELRILKGRLDILSKSTPLENRGVKSSRSLSLAEEDSSKKETLSGLLRIQIVGASQPLIALVISSQLQALKLIASKANTRVTEAAIEHLLPSVPYSPANLIEAQIDRNLSVSRAKGAQQLASLSQLLLSLCPSISSADDDGGATLQSMSPLPTLQVQLLALEIRSKWWKLATHRGDVAKEILEPLARYLVCFRRRSKMGCEAKYNTIKAAFEAFCTHADIIACPENPSLHKSLITLYQLLADVAQDSLLLDEALHWITNSSKISTSSGASPARTCALACRTAALQIRIGRQPQDCLLSTLKGVARDLEGDLSGDSTDLDDLVLATSSLRRAATSILREAYTSLKPDEKMWSAEVVGQSSKILLHGVRFLVRYIGEDPGEGSEKVMVRYLQRLKLVKEVSNPFIDSISVLARCSSASSVEDWEQIERGLQNCLRLAVTLDSSGSLRAPTIPKDDSNYSIFVLLSNAYWYRYLHLKQSSTNLKDLRRSLQASIDIVKTRSLAERIAANLPIKLEKCGLLHESARKFPEAADTYADALHVQVENGCLQVAAKAAAAKAVSMIFTSDSDQLLFGRLLIAYARATTRIDDKMSYRSLIFDNSTLPSSERGVLLEQQLIAVISIVRMQGVSERLRVAVQELLSSILKVYTKAEFPIRRYRVVNQGLHIQSTHPTTFDGGLLNQILDEHLVSSDIKSFRFDLGLEKFASHLVASRDISLVLCADTPNMQSIEIRLAEWSRLLQEHHEWASLQTRVSDMSSWLGQLELLSDYLAMQGLDLTRLSVLQVLVSIYEAATTTNSNALILSLSALGSQYVRLGYPEKAGRVLQKAEQYVDTGGSASAVYVHWHLAYARYSLEIGNVGKSEQHLSEAQNQFETGAQCTSTEKTNSVDRSRLIQMLAEVAELQSSLAAAKGHSWRALLLSRKSVKLNRRAWAILEHSQNKAAIPNRPKRSNEALTDLMSEISISKSSVQYMSTTHTALQGVLLWILVPRLFQGLYRLSEIYSRQGLLPEAQYYSEQCQRIAEAVKADNFKSQSLAQSGNYLVGSRDYGEGLQLLEQAQDVTSSLQRDRHFAALQLYLSRTHTLQGDWCAGESAAALCEQTLEALTSAGSINSLNHQVPISHGIEVQMRQLNLQDKTSAQRPRSTRRLPVKKPVGKSVLQSRSADSASKKVPTIATSTLSRLRGDVLRQRAIIAMYRHDPEMAANLLIESAIHAELTHDHISQELVAARLSLRQGLEEMASDPIFSVLPESTVSHPSTISTGGLLDQSPQKPNVITPPRNRPLKPSVRKPRRSRSPLPANFIELLRQAQDSINKVCMLTATASTTANMHSMTDIMTKTLMMLSATTNSRRYTATSPNFTVYMAELSRTVAMIRESQVIQVDKQLAVAQDIIGWPKDDDGAALQGLQIDKSLRFADFQKDYIDIIPASWNVISLSLSESQEEIRIAKIRSGQTPFILALPLNRHNSRDPDEEIFGFNQAKNELQDIIGLGNYSTRGAQDMSRKGAKSEWWKARTALDTRLKDLLINIESVWLGGFRGVFTQETHSPDLLSRFQQSLHNILNRYLPSRQKSGNGRKSDETLLDAQILELFIEMGDPDGMDDLDEPLMDLLYFVIDILQFNGERNAYDEIDFDSIAIETLDALRHYHHASKASKGGVRNQHTILILDKALHGFPWESLPCMSGLAISRLPSLGCLRDRILRQQQQAGAKSSNERWEINRQSGAYVLNPAGDLAATQAKFDQPLQGLPGWKSIIEREPSEDEIKGYLESRAVFLYFGHGSGGQYIRSSIIKKLDKCSIALLMGCSSGTLTEVGEFEPYGTPLNYMHAGCPALLATLWDVTDKDIDRFSYTVLEEWGLLQEAPTECSGSALKRGAKQRGGKKTTTVRNIERKTSSLNEAVARGRDSCILKYLNGAAPVLYGVPVFLSGEE